MITRRLVGCLGLSQLVLWGVSYYLVAVFGEPIAAEMGWSRPFVWGGFSAALTVMGVSSSSIGRLIDRHGGRPVMTAGSCLVAAGCLGLATARGPVLYYGAWLLLGLAMRMSLYDAAFATLARIGGAAARRSISQITLLGGLASTVLWPIGQGLAEAVGWRWALVVYAGLALLTVPLHLSIPPERFDHAVAPNGIVVPPLAVTATQFRLAAGLFVATVTLTTVLNSAMSSQMISILGGLGAGTGAAVWLGTLRGVGQSSARLGEVLFGSRLSPLTLGVIAAALVPVGFLLGIWGGVSVIAGAGFAILYGAGNGLGTIVRGTQPLVLFEPRDYGSLVGRLLTPSFFLSALSPIAFAALIDRWGAGAAIQLSLWIAVAILVLSVALWAAFRRTPAPGPQR